MTEYDRKSKKKTSPHLGRMIKKDSHYDAKDGTGEVKARTGENAFRKRKRYPCVFRRWLRIWLEVGPGFKKGARYVPSTVEDTHRRGVADPEKSP